MVHVGARFAVGLLFGSAILALTLGSSPEPLPVADLVSRGLNEILFPVGRALVLFSAGTLGSRISREGPP